MTNNFDHPTNERFRNQPIKEDKIAWKYLSQKGLTNLSALFNSKRIIKQRV
jgi:hypothetical protein